MKKLYTLLTLALAAATASAAGNTASLKKATETGLEMSPLRTAIEMDAPRRAAAKAPDYTAETWTSIGQGKYVASALAECYGGTKEAVDVEVFEAAGKSGLYKVVGVWPDLVKEGVLYVDATDPEMVQVKKQFTGITDNVDGVTYICTLSAVAMDEYDNITKEAFLANFADKNAYVDNGVITFPVGSLLLQWPEAPADSKYKTDPTEWYTYAKTDGRLILPGAEYVDPWGDAVDATMVENIIAPVFGKTNAAPYTVKIQRNNETGAYRVIDPWSQLYSALKFNSVSPNIEIDATDPTNLVVELQEIGINGGGTDGKYMLMSASYYNNVNEATTDDALKITLTENNDGTATISFPYRSTYVYASTSNKIYYGSNNADQTPSTITFKSFSAGIGNITADDDINAPVEYFNLQGVRVANPAAGQLVIKRQGSEVTKMVVR